MLHALSEEAGHEQDLRFYGEGYTAAREAGRNARSLQRPHMYLEPKTVFRGFAGVLANAIWQNEDGSVDILFTAYNGHPEWALDLDGMTLTMECGGQTVFHRYVTFRRTVYQGWSTTFTVHVDAAYVSGTDPWTGFSLHYIPHTK